MPIYEYSCSEGCPQWEEIQGIKESHTKECPVCNKNTAHRIISTGGFILKGRGFHKPTREEYENEYSAD